MGGGRDDRREREGGGWKIDLREVGGDKRARSERD